MAARGNDWKDQEVPADPDGRFHCGVRTRRRSSSAKDRRTRLSFRSRLGLGMLLVAVIIDLAAFELSARWSSAATSDSSDTEVTSRGAW
jgi:hypothetical protein